MPAVFWVTVKVLTTPIPQALKTLILYTPTTNPVKVLLVCKGYNIGPEKIS